MVITIDFIAGFSNYFQFAYLLDQIAYMLIMLDILKFFKYNITKLIECWNIKDTK